jgi:hypothetical protein
MSKQQKMIAMIAGGLVVAYLFYRYYQNNQTSSSTTGATAPDTSSGDYASLAGQEQSDVAALQGQNTQLASQEQSDVAGLGVQEQSDVSGLTAAMGGYSDQVQQILANEQAMTGAQSTIGGQISALAAGVTQLNRQATQTIKTNRGGPFYDYYRKVTGKAPPARVSASSFIYQAWKAGVKATALQAPNGHPSSKNKQIQHPNPTHTQRPAVKPAAPKPAPKPAAKPAPVARRVAPKPAPRPAPKSVKSKPSGVRR